MTAIGQIRRILSTTACAALLAGCGSDTSPEPATPDVAASGTAAPEGYLDPGRVCAGFAADRVAHDTTTDTGPADAHQRARRWLHPDLANHPPPAGRHPRWSQWSAHQVAVQVQTEPWAGEGLPTDTDDVAYRAVLVSTTPVGAHGWSGDTGWHTVYCTLGRAGEGWLITDYQIDGGGWTA